MADQEFEIRQVASPGPLSELGRAFVSMAPELMRVASLRVTTNGPELAAVALIVPESSSWRPSVSVELESALRTYIRSDWDRVRQYGDEWFIHFASRPDERVCSVLGPSDTTPDIHFDNWGPPKRAPRGAYKYKPPPRARKAKKQPPPEAGS